LSFKTTVDRVIVFHPPQVKAFAALPVLSQLSSHETEQLCATQPSISQSVMSAVLQTLLLFMTALRTTLMAHMSWYMIHVICFLHVAMNVKYSRSNVLC
jgi:hypothetical protein